jgi:hypothetical protein
VRLAVLAVLSLGSAAASAEPCRQAAVADPSPGRSEAVLPAEARIARDLALSNNTLVWSSGESLWRLRLDGNVCAERIAGRPAEAASAVDSLRVAVAGDSVVAVTRTALMPLAPTVAPSGTAVDALPETPQTFVMADGALYTSVWRGDAIYRVDLANGTVVELAQLAKGSGRFGFLLAVHGDTLYAASWGQRTLTAIPLSTGIPKVVARGLAAGPTALAIDDTNAYLYLESGPKFPGAVVAIELAKPNAKPRTLATGIANSDSLLRDGDWLYLRSDTRAKRGTIDLVRVPLAGGAIERVAADLPSPARPVGVDAEAIYLDGGSRIVRLQKP